MCVLNPHVHVLSEDAAVIAYTTLTQHLDKLVVVMAYKLLKFYACITCSRKIAQRYFVIFNYDKVIFFLRELA